MNVNHPLTVSQNPEERLWFVKVQIHVGAHSIQYVCDITNESDGAVGRIEQGYISRKIRDTGRCPESLTKPLMMPYYSTDQSTRWLTKTYDFYSILLIMTNIFTSFICTVCLLYDKILQLHVLYL